MPVQQRLPIKVWQLVRTYALVGYDPGRDYGYVETNRRLREAHPSIVDEAVGGIVRAGGHVERSLSTSSLLTVNREFSVSIVLSRHQETAAGSARWVIRLDTVLCPDLTIAVRMGPGNDRPLDYYILPFVDMSLTMLRLAERNGASLDTYRFESLEALGSLSARTAVREVA